MKIEKMSFEHRESVRQDGRVFQGHTSQRDYFDRKNNLVNVVLNTGGPIHIVPCVANGPMTGITISADLEQGKMSMLEKIEENGVVTFPVNVIGNPYRREPWVRVILYVTDTECYEALEKIILEDKIILVFQVLHM